MTTIHTNFDPSQRMRALRFTRSRNRVKRQLFGPVDHEETRKFLEVEWVKDVITASQAWDFDFDKGKPLQGLEVRYKWTRMPPTFAPRRPKKPEPEPDITELYASPLPNRVEEEKELLQIEDVEGKQDQKNQKKCDQEENKQTKITDFMVIRKRNSESISKKATEPVIPSKISKYNNVTS